MTAPRPNLPVLCKRCGGPAKLVNDVDVACPFCGATETLPMDAQARTRELRARLYAAGRASANVAGFVRTLASFYENRTMLLMSTLPYLLMLVIGGMQSVPGLLSLGDHDALSASAHGGMALFAAMPLFIVTGLSVAGLGTTWLGRALFRGRIRPLIAAAPPTATGSSARCRVCGGDLAPTPGVFLRCQYCGTDNLRGDDESRAHAAALRKTTQSHREKLATARVELERITLIGKVGIPAAFVVIIGGMFGIAAVATSLVAQ